MATGNLLLGLGRRSIGDITLYRTRGQQRARVRVREVANPRSFKQLATRAILSNVSQLYSIGKSIFDHSFEGLPVGQENQLRFQKVNIARLRALVNDDIWNHFGYDESRSRIGIRGYSMGVPFQGMQISEGSLVQDVFTFSGDTDSDFSFSLAFDEIADVDVSHFCSRRGLHDGDIFTFVGLAVNKNLPIVNIADADVTQGDEYYFTLYQTELKYVQLKVKEGAERDATALGNDSLISVVFDIYGANTLLSNALTTRTLKANKTVNWSDIVPVRQVADVEYYQGVMGCIRSRYDTGLRSTSFMETQGYTYGITPWTSLEKAWGDSAGIQSDPDLILPGENF